MAIAIRDQLYQIAIQSVASAKESRMHKKHKGMDYLTTRYWYLKEAFTKATGVGMGNGLDNVEFHSCRLERHISEDIHVFREINLDKVRAWKPFYKTNQQRGLGFLLLDKKQGDVDSITGMGKLGYEVFAEGLTRVLRICEFLDSHKRDPFFYSTSKMRFGMSNFSLQLLEYTKQENELGEASIYTSIISIRLENIDMLSIFTYQHRVNQLNIQSLAVDHRWIGAPFSAVLRRHQSDYFDPDDKTLRIVLISLSSGSTVYHIKYLSIILQALDLNLDEETLMRIGPFWRTSLSDPNTHSQLYYFDHFAIHPIKIVASFLPRESYASYSSTQETLRSLLHSVVKLYIEGYLQALLDTIYKQEYLRVRIVDNQVILKNLPPNSSSY